jgi:hypothetical protein
MSIAAAGDTAAAAGDARVVSAEECKAAEMLAFFEAFEVGSRSKLQDLV